MTLTVPQGNDANTQCIWTFGINTHDGSKVTQCKFVHNGKPASDTDGGPAKCGDFTVTSGWSDQFGKENAFTVLAVNNYSKRLQIFPSYTDKQIKGEKVVKPDQSYTPQSF